MTPPTRTTVISTVEPEKEEFDCFAFSSLSISAIVSAIATSSIQTVRTLELIAHT